jgi:hypothetical protein
MSQQQISPYLREKLRQPDPQKSGAGVYDGKVYNKKTRDKKRRELVLAQKKDRKEIASIAAWMKNARDEDDALNKENQVNKMMRTATLQKQQQKHKPVLDKNRPIGPAAKSSAKSSAIGNAAITKPTVKPTINAVTSRKRCSVKVNQDELRDIRDELENKSSDWVGNKNIIS